MPFFLPHQYRFAHRYSIFLHDLIVGKTRAAIEAGIFRVRFDLAPGDREAMPAGGVALYDWIEANRGAAVTVEMDYKLVIQALVVDFCHFVLEGLGASAKAKLTAAYVLTRKPFKDNLFYLEWLLADPDEFLVRFRQHPESIRLSKLGDEFMRGIIGDAVAKTEEPHQEPEFLYRLRYDRKAAFGLAPSWDQAAHLVTHFSAIQTEQHNFNFIFSGPEQWESQWNHLYSTLPPLLHHAVVVIDALFDTLATVPDDYTRTKRLRRELGSIEWRRSISEHDAARDVSAAELVAPLEGEALACPHCQVPLRLHTRNIRTFVLYGTIRCSTCRTTVQADVSDARAE